MTNNPIIAVVTDHTDKRGNDILVQLLNKLFEIPKYYKILKEYRFVFTGGTYSRIFEGIEGKPSKLKDEVKDFLLERTLKLPSFEDGGVTILSYLMVEKFCDVMWSFQTPNSPHHLVAQNNILRRNCDISGTKRLINTASIMYWLDNDAVTDTQMKSNELPLIRLLLKSSHAIKIKQPRFGPRQEIDIRELNKPCNDREQFLAIIVRKPYVTELNRFLRTHFPFLSTFKKILITNTVGLITDEKQWGDKIIVCDPVGKGGLVQVSMEVLFGRCDDLIIFDDEAIPDRDAYSNQVVLNACKRDQNVRVITNKNWAEKWAVHEYQKILHPETESSDSSKIFVENGSNVVEVNKKINTTTGESLPIINEIVKFNDLGFTINSEEMKINKLYHFEFDDSVYEIRKDQNNELGIRVLD